jgi:hypothetical protein
MTTPFNPGWTNAGPSAYSVSHSMGASHHAPAPTAQTFSAPHQPLSRQQQMWAVFFLSFPQVFRLMSFCTDGLMIAGVSNRMQGTTEGFAVFSI